MTDLQYPLGPFTFEGPTTTTARTERIARITAAPGRLRQAVAGLTELQLDTPYRPGGWTPRQIGHHLADSHMNAYIRVKLALTEDHPTIKPYEQARWAEGAEYRRPVDGALALLELLHDRWVFVFRSLSEADFARTFFHPETLASVSIDRVAAMYAWHGDHHIAQITGLREREGW